MVMKIVALALAIVLAAPPCFADEAPLLPLVPYEDQGNFVIQPAKFVAAPVYGVGFMLGAFVCLPISLVQQGSKEEPVPHDREASLICGKFTGVAIGWPVYAAVGLPLFILKKTFWDFPKAIKNKISPPKPEPAPVPAPAPAQ